MKTTHSTLLNPSCIINLIDRDDGKNRAYTIFDETGSRIDNAHWFEIAQQRWVKKYKDSSTPCSCWLCSGEKYNRIDYVKETQRMIRESLE